MFIQSRSVCCILLAFGCSLISIPLTAQKAKTHALTADEAKIVKKDAATMFASENYNGALKGYIDLQKSAPDNLDYNYKLGICYLMTNAEKKKAVAPLEFVIHGKEPKKESWFYLGMAYLFSLQYDEAIQAFNHFKSFPGVKPVKDFLPVDRLLEMCSNGKLLVAQPIDVSFENLGKSINTIYDEYNPYISADGNQLVFTSRRKGNMGGFIEDLGIFTADVYWSTWKDTAWTKAKGLGGMTNTEWDEECVSVSPDGNQLFLYCDNAESYADISVSTLKGKMWQKPVLLNEQVNSKGYEGAACMSMDGSMIIFSSTRKDGLGGSDLYTVKKEKNGEWGTALSIGSTLNTKYDEDAPFLSVNGKELYFSSKGHNSMGGYDVFRSTWNESSSTWSAPVNVGYPFNDAEDNVFISISGDGRYAYVSAIRPEGFGERDIYRVTFNNSTGHDFNSVINGSLVSLNGGKPEITRITLSDKNGLPVMDFKPGYTTNRFVLVAKPGTYSLKVEGYHFEPLTEELVIGDNDTATIDKVISVNLSK